MIEIYGKHFVYNDVYSSQYNLIIANVETSRETRLSGGKNGNFVFNKATKTRYLIDDDYADSPMSFEIDIVTCDGRAIELQTLKKIERWLFTNSTFKKLYVDIADDPFGETYELVYGYQKRLYLNCRFLAPEKLEYNNGVVGFRCTLETDSTMLWQDEVSASFDFSEAIYPEEEGSTTRLLRGDVDFDGQITALDAQTILMAAADIMAGLDNPLTEEQTAVADMDGDGEITVLDAQIALQTYAADLVRYPTEKTYIDVNGEIIHTPTGSRTIEIEVDSDIDGYTYPVITLYLGDVASDVTISNYDDDPDRSTSFTGLAAGSTITIDSVHSRVLSGGSTTGSVSLYNKMTSKRFPRLVGGENRLVVTGNIARLIISWQNRRFL